MDDFTRGYIECAFWSSMDDQGGEPLDAHYGIDDLAPETLAKMIADCEKFQLSNADDLAPFRLDQTGHDFWLTRNRHGAGFWDGDYPEDIGQRLTDSSHSYGSCDLYVGDDGKIYSSG